MARAQVRAPAPDEQEAQTAGDEGETPEAQGSDGTDSPILDLSDAAVKRMIKAAKARGYVTLDELNTVLPSEETSPELMQALLEQDPTGALLAMVTRTSSRTRRAGRARARGAVP